MFRSGNPTLSEKAFNHYSQEQIGEVMTVQGTIKNSFVMLFLLVASSLFVWSKASSLGLEAITVWTGIGFVASLILAIVTTFKKEWAAFTAPFYAVTEGLLIGGISIYAETQFPGIVFQAVTLTFGTFFCLLFAYTSGYIKATENFKAGMVSAMGGIFIVYLASFVLGIFGIQVPLIHSSGLFGIGFSVFVVIIAALNLVLDFDFIEKAAEKRLPKYFEWYGAFALTVTLVWLYLEILRLLIKLNSRRD